MILVAMSLVLMGAVLWRDFVECVRNTPPAETGEGLAWEGDTARLELRAPLVPHRFGLAGWMAAWLGVLLPGAVGIFGMALSTEATDITLAFTGAGVVIVTLGLLLPGAGLVGFQRRAWRLDCTHDRLVLRRPLARTRMLSLAALQDVDTDGGSLVLSFAREGRLRVPMPEGEVFDEWVTLLRAAHRRALCHAEDLSAVEVDRRAVLSVVRRSVGGLST